LNKKSILSKTIQFGSFTFLSRILGLGREMLMSRYVGTTPLGEAFMAAFRLPNSLRKIFAEGALTAAFVPTFVNVLKNEGKDNANSLLSITFLFFESIVFFLCMFAFFNAKWIVFQVAPGFSAEAISLTIPLLRILISFILFISSSALLAGALQAVNHFVVPAFSPILLNVFFIGGIILAWRYGYSIDVLCYAIIIAGLFQFLLHLVVYFSLGFRFGRINKKSWQNLQIVLWKFLPVVFSMSVMEVNFYYDQRFASYFPKGLALLYYSFRFMGIALGVFSVAFSTVLLPHFTRISNYAPKRLSFYLLESAKFVFWVIIPITILMSFFSEEIFSTLFMSSKFPYADVIASKSILKAFLTGLFFFSINKILLNIYYALHNTSIPAVVSVIGTATNIGLNYLLMRYWQTLGLAIATSISGGIMTVLLVALLNWNFDFKLYAASFFQFTLRYIIQLACMLTLFFVSYFSIKYCIGFLPNSLSYFFNKGIGIWAWVMPLSTVLFWLLYKTKETFKVKLYFLS
jgi:putative peptidoglycan lipid II flippase